mmetsp:Transcript_46425/g.72685  ORF Transcript_46425/g.72685 Transcript_46425/m.72685 type:complete len:131 (-) Transcript_46425:459-851(-)
MPAPGAGRKRTGPKAADVADMEHKLEMLKQQMAAERQKREELLSNTGSGSYWLNGREGTLRGKEGVKQFVKGSRQIARGHSARRKAEQDQEPQEQLIANEPEQPVQLDLVLRQLSLLSALISTLITSKVC